MKLRSIVNLVESFAEIKGNSPAKHPFLACNITPYKDSNHGPTIPNKTPSNFLSPLGNQTLQQKTMSKLDCSLNSCVVTLNHTSPVPAAPLHQMLCSFTPPLLLIWYPGFLRSSATSGLTLIVRSQSVSFNPRASPRWGTSPLSPYLTPWLWHIHMSRIP